MYVDRNQLAVLQAVVNRVSVVGQLALYSGVREDSGLELEAFHTARKALMDECLIKEVAHHGHSYLTLTGDALQVEGLDTTTIDV
jgi:hypothetical protein